MPRASARSMRCARARLERECSITDVNHDSQAWAEMNASSAQAVRAPVHARSKTKGGRSKKAQKILAEIFGAKQAAVICHSASAARAAAPTASSAAVALPARVPRKTAVTEVVKFAGQTIECVF